MILRAFVKNLDCINSCFCFLAAEKNYDSSLCLLYKTLKNESVSFLHLKTLHSLVVSYSWR
jgi:hypothetical protein